MEKLTLAIDFDGTIVKELYPDIGSLLPGAKEYINKLYDDGHYIIIWTCRSEGYEIGVVEFLDGMNIKYHQVNENELARIEKYGSDSRKISADIYIDDKNLGGLPNWPTIYEMVLAHATSHEVVRETVTWGIKGKKGVVKVTISKLANDHIQAILNTEPVQKGTILRNIFETELKYRLERKIIIKETIRI